jgi:hypothetical protein
MVDKVSIVFLSDPFLRTTLATEHSKVFESRSVNVQGGQFRVGSSVARLASQRAAREHSCRSPLA